jgi:hypothetical protein
MSPFFWLQLWGTPLALASEVAPPLYLPTATVGAHRLRLASAARRAEGYHNLLMGAARGLSFSADC